MQMHNEVPADAARLSDLIKDIRVAMFTTMGENDRPHTRPMYTQQAAEYDGFLWFFTDADAAKVREIRAGSPALATYADSGKNTYVAVSGTAEVVDDPAKAQELWNVHAKGWWPQGPQDPRLALVRVRVESAEYWDGGSHAGYMLKLLKAVVTGTRVEPRGEHGVART